MGKKHKLNKYFSFVMVALMVIVLSGCKHMMNSDSTREKMLNQIEQLNKDRQTDRTTYLMIYNNDGTVKEKLYYNLTIRNNHLYRAYFNENLESNTSTIYMFSHDKLTTKFLYKDGSESTTLTDMSEDEYKDLYVSNFLKDINLDFNQTKFTGVCQMHFISSKQCNFEFKFDSDYEYYVNFFRYHFNMNHVTISMETGDTLSFSIVVIKGINMDTNQKVEINLY